MRRLLLTLVLGAFAGATPAAPPAASAAAPARTAAEVIDRNVAARGGLAAWRRVETMVWLGHLERTSTKDAQKVPFVMQLRRPNLTRFELKEQFSQFTRIFDGHHGWKMRPAGDGRPETKAFSTEEDNFARTEFVIDGPLIDYQAKGITAELDGIDVLDGQKAYRLSLKLPTGAERKVWIDVKTNLELRYDRPATNPLKPGAPVSVYYRDYQTASGLKVPMSIEIGVAPGRSPAEAADRLVIDQVMVNPKLDDAAFSMPARPMRRGPAHVRIPAGAGPSQ